MKVASPSVRHADAVVTNDRHLLDLDSHGTVRVLRPADAVRRWLDETSSPKR